MRSRCTKSANLASRLFAGEVLTLELDDRHVAVGVAKRQLFVVAILAQPSPALDDVVDELRRAIEGYLADAAGELELPPPTWGGSGGSGSGPAELPVIELGITAGRTRGKA
jgi:hypothetical protein